MINQHAVRLSGIRKTFGNKVAVEGIDLAVERGEMVGVIGPNGAGKSTTIRMLMGIMFPDSGELEVLSKRSALESRDRVGYLPEERGVYKKMRVSKFLRYMAGLKGIPPRRARAVIPEWLERVDLPGVMGKRCDELSKGMQQKVQFVASVMHEPELLILDEPFSGLDPVNKRLLSDLIEAEHRRGCSVLFSTHVMAQAEEVCNRVVMIHEGNKVLDDTIAGIRASHPVSSLLFEPAEGGSVDAAASVPGVQDAVPGPGRLTELRLQRGADPARVLSAVAAATPTVRVELRRPSLEDVFIGIVTREVGDADSEALRQQLTEQPEMGGAS